MRKRSKYQLYLQEVGHLVKKYALEVKNHAENMEGEDRIFNRGIVFGYHAVLSLMQQEAAAFGIELEELRLDDINPDRDLL